MDTKLEIGKAESSASEGITPIAQEFQAVFHIGGSPGLAHFYQPPQFLANGGRLLVADDDASVVASLPEEFGMQPAKVGRVAGVNGALLFHRPRQLLRVRTLHKPALAARSDVPSAMTQPIQQSMGIGIFVQMKLQRAQVQTAPLLQDCGKQARSSSRQPSISS